MTEGFGERSHKQYLNDYFQGYAGNSTSRGELYNADPVTGDARFCGTTASMCGIEKAGFEQDEEAMERAICLDVMLHAYMFMQSGIPVLYGGDEIGHKYFFRLSNPLKPSQLFENPAFHGTLIHNFFHQLPVHRPTVDIAGILRFIRVFFIGIVIDLTDFIASIEHRNARLHEHSWDGLSGFESRKKYL